MKNEKNADPLKMSGLVKDETQTEPKVEGLPANVGRVAQQRGMESAALHSNTVAQLRQANRAYSHDESFTPPPV